MAASITTGAVAVVVDAAVAVATVVAVVATVAVAVVADVVTAVARSELRISFILQQKYKLSFLLLLFSFFFLPF